MTATAKKAKTPAKKKFTKPKLALYTVKATIPTANYGNIQPEIQVEAASFEEAQAFAMPEIEKLWAQYAMPGAELKKRDAPKAVAGSATLIRLESDFTENFAFFDPVTHRYTADEKGEGRILLSGSAFCHQYEREFPKADVLKAMQEKYQVPAEDIEKMWNLKAEASSGWGTALHAALELYGKYKDLGEITGATKGVNSAMHDNPALQTAVELFYKDRNKEEAAYEAFVYDEEEGLVGQIDRLRIVNLEKKIVRVQDYKTNVNIDQAVKIRRPFESLKTKADSYRLQLSFYAYILAKKGWTIEGLDIFHWDGKQWNVYQSEPLDLTDILGKEN